LDATNTGSVPGDAVAQTVECIVNCGVVMVSFEDDYRSAVKGLGLAPE
jgi:hypothetical protein